jgi:hypothetical protein
MCYIGSIYIEEIIQDRRGWTWKTKSQQCSVPTSAVTNQPSSRPSSCSYIDYTTQEEQNLFQ